MDISKLRQNYTRAGLDKSEVDPDPIKQLTLWMQQALDGGIREPNAASIATASLEGQPNQRLVLIKGIDASGLVFYTNYNSTKGKEIAANPKLAVLFPWVELEREIRILGTAKKISREESATYFNSRPVGSRLAACTSAQSKVVSSRSELDEQFAAIAKKYDDGNIPLPDCWGGYRITPHQFEFWQGREKRLHDRIQYTKNKDGASWRIERLAP